MVRVKIAKIDLEKAKPLLKKVVDSKLFFMYKLFFGIIFTLACFAMPIVFAVIYENAYFLFICFASWPIGLYMICD
jgi:hypothetical protein